MYAFIRYQLAAQGVEISGAWQRYAPFAVASGVQPESTTLDTSKKGFVVYPSVQSI
jgi:hypothetical protein